MQKDANLSEIEMLKKAEEQGTPFAIGDENLASPSEIESTETVVLPEIQSMTAYIRYHYEKEILGFRRAHEQKEPVRSEARKSAFPACAG